jgi:hypothetical protein
MYGLINKAVRELVLEEFGSETWDRIREEANVADEAFVSMERYPDEVTYSLVGASSKVLGISPAEVLETFGEYWVKFADESYGEFLTSAGDSFPEFLQNLDEMHARIQLVFPELIPPSFRVASQEGNRVQLHYHSEREGLAPLAVGMLTGVSKRFGVDLSVQHARDSGDRFDVFDITYAPTESDPLSK